MNSLTTLSVSRTPRFVERTSVPTSRDNKPNLHSPSATASQRDSAMGRFLTALLRALSTAAA